MYQDPLPFLKTLNKIEIVLGTKDFVKCRNGYLECQLSQENFHHVGRRLWRVMMKEINTKERSPILNAVICPLKERKR